MHKKEVEESKNKFKKLKRNSFLESGHKRLETEAAEELGEFEFKKDSPDENGMDLERQLTFVPRIPPPREKIPSPLSKIHARGPKISPLPTKTNYEGEQNMLVVFEAIRKEPPGFFLYLTHTYSKSSNEYNFYNVK